MSEPNIQIGDIIELVAPTNQTMHNKTYFIEYIDNDLITLINTDNLSDIINLTITNGSLQDTSIIEINILDRPDELGYARQHGLVINTWIDIMIGGDEPSIIIGKITNLEEDMIEITTYPSNEIIYIDFEYKGIPKMYNITNITIRSQPIKSTINKQIEFNSSIDATTFEPNDMDDMVHNPIDNLNLNNIIIDADAINFDFNDGITIFMEVNDNDKIIDIDKQVNDLLDDVLASIPLYQRTNKIMDNINKLIARFKEVRQLYSTINNLGRIDIKQFDNPLKESLNNIDKKLYWILPVSNNIKKIYNIESSIKLNDIINSDQIESMINIREQYESYNNLSNDGNKYKTYLNIIHNIEQPFINKDKSTTQLVNDNITAIVGNNNLFSTTLKNENIYNKKYYLQNYNTYFNKYITNDSINIHSYIMLTKPAIQFSKINLNMTNIYDKTHLNLNHLQYWKFLNIKTNINNKSLFTSFDKITHYSNTDLTTILPSNKDIFDYIISTHNNILSCSQFINLMEPFLIYYDNISYSFFKDIKKHVDSSIISYVLQTNDKIKQTKIKLNKIKRKVIKMTLIDDLLPNNNMYNKNINDMLNLKEPISNIELLNLLINTNIYKLFISSIVIENNILYDNSNAKKLIHIDDSLLTTAKKPTKYEYFKEYNTLHELLNDNNIDIYVDNYDPTKYNELIQSYSNTFNVNDLKLLLVDKLTKYYKLSKRDAMREAIAIINKQKKIEDGDYALLHETNTTYIRKNNAWKPLTDEKDDVSISLKNITHTNIEKILSEFEYDNVEQTTIIDNYSIIYEQSKIMLKINKLNLLKFNNIKYNLSLQYDNTENKPHSEFEKIRDIILGQTDIVKKYNDIQKFKLKYTREPFKEEDKYWLYCIEKNVKLLPMFLVKLSSAFITGQYAYLLEIEKICQEQGTISDDGNAWVDKYSGYIIKNQMFTVEDEYNDKGFKVISNDVMEEPFIDTDWLLTQSDLKYKNKIKVMIKDIVQIVAYHMNVDIDNHLDFIIDNTIKTINEKKLITSEANYLKQNKKTSYTDYVNKYYMYISLSYLFISVITSIPSITNKLSYKYCKQSFTGYPLVDESIDITGLEYLVCIVSKIKTNYQPWNVIASKQADIMGYFKTIIDKFILINPAVSIKIIEKNSENNKNKSIQSPNSNELIVDYNYQWTFLPVHHINNIKLKPNISEEFKKDLKNKQTTKQQQINVINGKIIYFSIYIQFLIQKIINNHLPLLTNSVNKPFLENVCCNNSNKKTINYFIDIDNDINKYNNIVLELSNIINDLVSRSTASTLIYKTKNNNKLLVTTHFTTRTIYLAFIKYCNFNNIKPINSILQPICLTKPNIEFDNFDNFDNYISQLQQTGYKYDIESLNKLMDIIFKQNRIKLNFNTSIKNTIEYLINSINISNAKSNANNLSDDSNNSNDDSNNSSDDSNDKIKNDKTNEILLNYFTNLNNNKLSTNETKSIKELLYTTNKELFDYIKTFTKNNKLIMNFIDELFKFNEITSNFVSSDKETLFRLIQFMKNICFQLIHIYPVIILNKNKYTTYIPKHWKLSENHNNNIDKMLLKNHTLLNKFFNNDDIKDMLYNVNNSTDILKIINNIVYISTSEFDADLVTYLLKYYFLKIIECHTKSIENSAIVVNYLELVLEKINKDKSTFDYNYDMIMQKVLSEKEIEKNNITEKFKGMNDETREIKNMMKNNKLGEWNVGLQKGLTKYVGEFYDKEMLDAEQQAEIDKYKDNPDGIVNQQLNQEIENEVYDLNDYHGEEDDYPDGDDGDGEY